MINRILAVIISFGFLAVACDNPSGVDPVDLTLSVTFDESYGNLPAADVQVTMTNVTSQQAFNGSTDTEGQVLFEDLPSGNYDIQALLTLDAGTVQSITGVLPSTDEITFNASVANVLINPGTQVPAIELVSGRLGDLVFKQIYFAGSDRVEGALFRDQFLEIYNNSNETIYVDGLYVMGVFGNASTSRTEYVTETGQFDWNQSIGMPTDIDANADYLHAKWIYQIPGTGEEYPLEPGESIVIAQTALNHQAPYTDNGGNTVTVGDPSLTVDLSDADFEGYVGDQFPTPLASDVDNPSVPNLRPIYIFGREMILDNLGRDGFVLFRSDEVDGADLPAYPSPISREIRDNTRMYPQIPIEWVIDAVETQPSPSNQIPRKLQNVLDAGYAYVPGGGYSSNSIIRLEAQRFGDRVVLKDTNNSTEDFTFLERAEPRVDAPQSPNTTARYLFRTNRVVLEDPFLDNLESQWARSTGRR